MRSPQTSLKLGAEEISLAIFLKNRIKKFKKGSTT
jgi:hypothetical protein